MQQAEEHLPLHFTIGLQREQQHQFDDLPELQKHPAPYRITEIEIQYTNDHIVGTQFKYITGDGKHVDGHNVEKFKPFGELFGQVHKKSFKIDEDDDLLEISGYVAANINHLAFKTYKGQHEGYGPKTGTHFAHSYPGHTFGAVSGGHESHLEYLRFHINTLHPIREHLRQLLIVEKND